VKKYDSKKSKKKKKKAAVAPAGMFYDATTLWEAVENARFGVEDVDKLLIDLLVYKRPEVVQEALTLLINRHCQRQRMLTTLCGTQLLVFTNTCKRLEVSMKLLVKLERDFEEYESWSLQANADTRFVIVEAGLNELSEMCLIVRFGSGNRPRHTSRRARSAPPSSPSRTKA
jgi:metal-responsive CopG/Arc/MetJ family transcriptional regulator